MATTEWSPPPGPTGDETVGPVTIGEPGREVVVSATLTHVAYHYLLAAMGSGRIGTDDSVPGEISAVALRLYLLRRPTTPTRNQWMDWEQALTEAAWQDRLAEQIRGYGQQVKETIGQASSWFAGEQWPTWRPELTKVLDLLADPAHREAVERTLPVLERTQRSTFGPRTSVQLLPRRSFRTPVAFDRPLAIDLRMTLPAPVKLLELLFHQLIHELATTSYHGGTTNLLHELDAALKRYSSHDPSLDVWHSVAHFGAADLARRALGIPGATAPGDRDLANTRRLFLEPESRTAWNKYAEETIDVEEFADRIARATVRSNV